MILRVPMSELEEICVATWLLLAPSLHCTTSSSTWPACLIRICCRVRVWAATYFTSPRDCLPHNSQLIPLSAAADGSRQAAVRMQSERYSWWANSSFENYFHFYFRNFAAISQIPSIEVNFLAECKHLECQFLLHKVVLQEGLSDDDVSKIATGPK